MLCNRAKLIRHIAMGDGTLGNLLSNPNIFAVLHSTLNHLKSGFGIFSSLFSTLRCCRCILVCCFAALYKFAMCALPGGIVHMVGQMALVGIHFLTLPCRWNHLSKPRCLPRILLHGTDLADSQYFVIKFARNAIGFKNMQCNDGVNISLLASIYFKQL